MSMPSDVNPDVAEAVEKIEARVPPKVKSAGRSLFRKVTSEQVGFAAAVAVAFVGVAICGPRVAEMRKPKRQRLADKARQAARQTRERAEEARDKAGRRLKRLGGGTIRAR